MIRFIYAPMYRTIFEYLRYTLTIRNFLHIIRYVLYDAYHVSYDTNNYAYDMYNIG